MQLKAIANYLIDSLDTDDGLPIDAIDDSLSALIREFPRLQPIYDAIDHSEGALFLNEEDAAALREQFR